MTRSTITIFFLANIAITFGVFYGLLKLSLTFNISPWLAAGAAVGLYAAFFWRECRMATVAEERRSFESRQPDQLGE